MKPKQPIKRFCELCNETTRFQYSGMYLEKGRKKYDIYDCSICSSSQILNVKHGLEGKANDN